MSHFTVLVIGNDPEAQLAPFQEELEVEFNDVTDEYAEKYKTDTTYVFIDPDGNMHSRYSEHFRVSKGFDSSYVCPEGWTEAEVPVSEMHPDFDTYMTDYCGYKKNDQGRYGYMHNPDAEWDWYSLGGRWTGYFKLKPEAEGVVGSPGLQTPRASFGYVDQALKRDIDFDAMRQEKRAKAHERYDEYEANKGNLKVNPYFDFGIHSTLKEGTIRAYTQDDYRVATREEHVEKAGQITTFAVLKDGEWYERGDMGWWGTVSDEKNPGEWNAAFEKLLAETPDDALLSLYDCHI